MIEPTPAVEPPIALITGAAGQDGALLAASLLSRGRRVVGVVRSQGPASLDPARTALLRGVELETLDLTQVDPLRDLLRRLRPDEVYHLAAAHHSSEANRAVGPAEWSRMTAVNFAAVEAIAATVAAELPATRIVVASSSQIWTPSGVDERVDEATPWRPSTYYGRTKCWAMDCLRHYRSALGIRATAAVLFNHESPLRAPAFVTRRVSRHAAAVRLGLPSTLHLRNVGARVDWSDARDVVEALARMGEGGVPGEYVVASGAAHSIRELLDAAFAGWDAGWETSVTFDQDEPAASLVGVTNRAVEELGWRPAVLFEDMVARMVEADIASLSERNQWVSPRS